MTLITREGLAAPTVPKETVPVPSLDGDVIVRGLLLSEQLALTARVRQGAAVAVEESDQEAGIKVGSRRVVETLHLAVELGDGLPMWSAAEWDAFGAKNPVDALALYQVANRLSGQDIKAAEKN